MAYQRYSWAWSKTGGSDSEVPIHPQPAAGHLDATGDTRFVGRDPSWQQDTAVPSLPPELIDLDIAAPTARGGGPVADATTDPGYGAGTGAGLDNEQSSVVRAQWVMRDDGSVAASHFGYQPDTDHTDYPSDVHDPGDNLFSPQTVDQQYQKGVGSPYSPNSTPDVVRRIMRWTDRAIDWHRWVPEMQLRYSHAGQGTPEVPAEDLGANVTPFPANAGWRFVAPDRLLAPERQVTPRPWGETMTQDGTLMDTAVALGSWGL
jgi:hypothetical protein